MHWTVNPMSENGLHRIPVMRAALVAIQELHKPAKGWISEREYLLYCSDCGDATYPCKTRKLADEALGGEERG